MELLGNYETRYPIISFIQNKDQLALDLSFKRRYFFHALQNLKITCVEFTSFKDVIDRYSYTRKANIKKIALPISIKEVSDIAHNCFVEIYDEDLLRQAEKEVL